MLYKNYIDLVDTLIKQIYKETDCFAESQDEAYKLANYLELRIKEVSRHHKEGGSYEEF